MQPPRVQRVKEIKEAHRMTHLYIVQVFEDGETFEYEFGNLKHAKELFDNESSAQLLEYKDGKHHMMDAK